MPLFEFYSVEKRDIIRKQFEYVTTHGELELYCFKKDAKDKESMAYRYATLFVKVSETQVLFSRFGNDSLQRIKGTIPNTMQGWKDWIKEDLEYKIENKMPLPPDAWYFGYTDEQAEQAKQAYLERKEKERKEREEKEAARKLDEEQKKIKLIEEAKEKIKKNELVSGYDLVEVARSIGIDVHPRTVSVLRKKVYSINSYTGSVCRSLSSYRGARLVYKQVKECLTEQESHV